MGILDIFRPTAVLAGVTTAEQVQAALGSPSGTIPGYRDPSRLPYASPLSPDSTLSKFVWTDLFGDARASVNSRASAMRLGTIARGRNLICGTVMRFPLVAIRGDRLNPDGTTMLDVDGMPVPNILSAAEVPWALATEDGSSWQHRTAWTIDDLIFHGWSLWHRRNGADGFPLAATHVTRSDWTVDEDNRLCVHGSPVANPREWTLIPGLHEGILEYGADVLRDARDLYAIVRERIEVTTPPVSLEAQPGAERLDPAEIDAVIASYIAARKRNGGVGYTNEWLKVVALKGTADSELLIEARNAAAVDLARIIGIHAGMVDATAPKASLNYETTTGRNQEFLDLDLALYMTPLAARLSLDDFVPRGTRVDFDTRQWTGPRPSPTGPNTED